MIHLKKGVRITGIKAEILFGITILNTYFERMKRDLWITAVRDGKHGENSLHYGGYACDIRLRNLDGNDNSISSEDLSLANVYAKDLREMLGQDFDLVVESDHFHLEYDPK